MVASSDIGKANAALKAALEARKKSTKVPSPEQEQFARDIAEREALLAEVFAIPDQAERRRLLDEVGLSHISAAPQPIEPIKGAALRVPTRSPQPAPIDWQFWRAMPHVKLWQACALAVGLDPDKLKPHPQGWMAGTGASSPVVIDDRSFRNLSERERYDKALRLASAGVSYMDGPIRPRGALVPCHHSRKDVALSDVAQFLARAGVEVSPEMLLPESKAHGETAKTESAEERQERRVKMCEDDGIEFGPMSLLRLPDGVGKVADKEGVSRQAFSADVKAGLERRENLKKQGRG